MDKHLERMRALRAVRAALYEQLAILDQLGEMLAAIELNSTIELLNAQLGEQTSDEEIRRLQRNYLSD
ncbi:hypothetical protein [Sphingopyxis sp.]|jgi:hypothetical protein|uniref:hypothetical protein n=1 Tax=Sphingopyxis sp. TaxID=1908224 RepID=UPI002FCB6403